MITKLERWINGALLASSMVVVLSSCHKDPDDPVPPVVKTTSQSLNVKDDVSLQYAATLNNVNTAVLKVSRDGQLIFTEDISDVAQNGPDFQVTYSYKKDDSKLKNITRGKYTFELTAGDIIKTANAEIVDFPTFIDDINWDVVENVPSKKSTSALKDKNLEQMPITLTGVKSVDGKTKVTYTTTATGYDFNVTAVSGSSGSYQLELDFKNGEGKLDDIVLGGQIGKDNRIVINPLKYTDNPNAAINSMTKREDMDNYILGALLSNPGNKVTYSDTYYNCIMYKYQLYIDTRKLKNKLRASSGLGKTWLYNNSKETSIDSIYVNGGTLANAGTIEAPIFMVNITDYSHSPPLNPFGHAMNGSITGRDKSTGNILTNFANYNFIEPQADAINVQIGTYKLKKDLDEVSIVEPIIVEDPINGDYLDYVTLVKFRIDNGVPTLTYENTDPKYNIIKE